MRCWIWASAAAVSRWPHRRTAIFLRVTTRKPIASKYPNVARSYFDRKGMDVRIIKIEGSVELAPLIGLADGIVDIVETGSTLKENGLEVVETISPISARLIVNVACMKLRKEEIESLIVRMESNRRMRGRRGNNR